MQSMEVKRITVELLHSARQATSVLDITKSNLNSQNHLMLHKGYVWRRLLQSFARGPVSIVIEFVQ